MALLPTKKAALPPRAHLPALDGLRGLAVLAVIFFHIHLIGEERYVYGGIPGVVIRSCWCGVDLFFVLSGFLITGILLDGKGAPHYFRNFYARRALRILPLYYGLLAVVFLVGPLFRALSTPRFEALAQNQLPLWLYTCNLSVARVNDFNFGAEWIEFNHFWSLAIEEQFYLLWPAVVLLCGRRTLAVVCVTLIGTALLLRGAFIWHGFAWHVDHTWTVYALTPCRWDGLALGGLLALAYRAPGWWKRLAWPAGIAAIASFLVLAALAAYENGIGVESWIVQVFGYSLLALFFGALLILAVNAPGSGIAGRAWCHPVLRFFGKYSYGLYVVHPTVMEQLTRILPLDALARWSGAPALGGGVFALASLGLSVALAWLSWHLYEKHFLKLKALFETRSEKASGVLP
jgi:peptidoglycan/LPS O-acetylase OafA/YrhL